MKLLPEAVNFSIKLISQKLLPFLFRKLKKKRKNLHGAKCILLLRDQFDQMIKQFL